MKKQFSDKLKSIRENMNLTQNEFADYVGFRQSNISAWEIGRSLPSLECLVKLSQLLHCTVDYLIGKNNNSLVDDFNIFYKLFNSRKKYNWSVVLDSLKVELNRYGFIDDNFESFKYQSEHGFNDTAIDEIEKVLSYSDFECVSKFLCSITNYYSANLDDFLNDYKNNRLVFVAVLNRLFQIVMFKKI